MAEQNNKLIVAGYTVDKLRILLMGYALSSLHSAAVHHNEIREQLKGNLPARTLVAQKQYKSAITCIFFSIATAIPDAILACKELYEHWSGLNRRKKARLIFTALMPFVGFGACIYGINRYDEPKQAIAVPIAALILTALVELSHYNITNFTKRRYGLFSGPGEYTPVNQQDPDDNALISRTKMISGTSP